MQTHQGESHKRRCCDKGASWKLPLPSSCPSLLDLLLATCYLLLTPCYCAGSLLLAPAVHPLSENHRCHRWAQILDEVLRSRSVASRYLPPTLHVGFECRCIL